jgi:hypothetical protein
VVVGSVVNKPSGRWAEVTEERHGVGGTRLGVRLERAAEEDEHEEEDG